MTDLPGQDDSAPTVHPRPHKRRVRRDPKVPTADKRARQLVVLMPLLFAIVVPIIFAGQTIFSATPLRIVSLGNDEMYYWHQTASFLKAGFHAGYYSFDGNIPPAGWSHFDAHGPWYPLLFGAIGSLVGWHYVTPILANIFFVLIGSFVFIKASRVAGRELMLAAAFILTFWPLWMFLISGMQEPLHFAVALAMAGLTIRILRSPNVESSSTVALFSILTVISLLRPTWSSLVIPLLYLTKPTWSTRRLAASSAVFIGAMYAQFTWVGSPYPYGFLAHVDLGSPLHAAGLMMQNLFKNFGRILLPGTLRHVEVLLHYQLLLLLVGAWLLVRHRRREIGELETRQLKIDTTKGIDPSSDVLAGELHWRKRNQRALLTALTAVAIPLIPTLTLYSVGNYRDFRVLAPHLLFALLVVCCSAPEPLIRKAIAIFVTTNIVTFPAFVNDWRGYNGGRFDDIPVKTLAFQKVLAKHVTYVPGADPWCNTLLWSSNRNPFPNDLVGVPRGIGISIVLSPRHSKLKKKYRGKIKARWIATDSSFRYAVHDIPQMERIATTPFGALYRNLAADCERPA